jgi:hypothetical protein
MPAGSFSGDIMTAFPTSLHTWTNKTDGVDDNLAADVNQAHAELVAIEAELGTDPAGSATDLKTRLAKALAGDGCLDFSTSAELTIATGSITPTQNWHTVDTESDGVSDDLDTIVASALTDGFVLFFRPNNTARTVVVKHNTGNIYCVGAADLTLDDDSDLAVAIYDATLSKWICFLALPPSAPTAGVGIAVSGQQVSLKATTATILLTAGGGKPTTTSPCAAAAKYEAGTNDVDVMSLDFDKDTQEYAFWEVQLPPDYDGGTITAKFIWMANATSGDVIWGLAARAYGDAETLDQAYGTAQEVTDTQTGTAYQVLHSAATSAITIAGTPAAGELAVLRAYRKAAAAGDTLAVDAKLLGVLVTYTRS